MSTQADGRRTTLPIPDAQYAGPTLYDAKDPDAKFTPIEPLRPRKGAPNVLIILLDDVGFGASSAFDGPIHTPTAEALAAHPQRDHRSLAQRHQGQGGNSQPVSPRHRRSADAA